METTAFNVDCQHELHLGDHVVVIEPGYESAAYEIVDVIGTGDCAQYAVRDQQTGDRYGYFGPEHLKPVQGEPR